MSVTTFNWKCFLLSCSNAYPTITRIRSTPKWVILKTFIGQNYFLKFSTFSTFQIVVPPTKQPIAQSETGNGNRKKRPGKALYVPKALRDKPKPSGGTEEVRFQFHVNFIWRKINNDFIFFRENRVSCHMLLLPKLFLKWKHGKMRLKVKLVPFK